MSTLAFLNNLVGAQVLGDHLTAWANHLVDNEGLARADAYRCVTDWADEGDPGRGRAILDEALARIVEGRDVHACVEAAALLDELRG